MTLSADSGVWESGILCHMARSLVTEIVVGG